MTIYIFTYWSTSIAKSDRPGEGVGDANLGDQHNGPGVGEWLHLHRDDPGGQAISPISRCMLGEGDPVLAVNFQVGGAAYLGWGREGKVAWVCPVPNHVLMPIDQGSHYWIFSMEGMVAFTVGGCPALICVPTMTPQHPQHVL